MIVLLLFPAFVLVVIIVFAVDGWLDDRAWFRDRDRVYGFTKEHGPTEFYGGTDPYGPRRRRFGVWWG